MPEASDADREGPAQALRERSVWVRAHVLLGYIAMDPQAYARIARTPSFHDDGHGFDLFGFHPPTLAAAVRASRLLYEKYFRVDSLGAEEIPAHGPAIVIANHGGVLPLDATMLCLDILHRTDRIPRAIADRFVPRLPIVSTFFARLGVVSGTRANVRALLDRGELIAIWPEGTSGTGKRMTQRYQLQRWNVGFAELAIRYRAPVIPAAVIGAEESWPLLAKLSRLHPFGSPYLPIPATLLPLPVRFHIRYGTPLDLAEGTTPADADDPAIVADAADRARDAVSILLAEARAARRGVFR
jgi:1-acyl-sn-glycerol-3-phosphate acyltransferase